MKCFFLLNLLTKTIGILRRSRPVTTFERFVGKKWIVSWMRESVLFSFPGVAFFYVRSWSSPPLPPPPPCASHVSSSCNWRGKKSAAWCQKSVMVEMMCNQVSHAHFPSCLSGSVMTAFQELIDFFSGLETQPTGRAGSTRHCPCTLHFSFRKHWAPHNHLPDKPDP